MGLPMPACLSARLPTNIRNPHDLEIIALFYLYIPIVISIVSPISMLVPTVIVTAYSYLWTPLGLWASEGWGLTPRGFATHGARPFNRTKPPSGQPSQFSQRLHQNQDYLTPGNLPPGMILPGPQRLLLQGHCHIGHRSSAWTPLYRLTVWPSDFEILTVILHLVLAFLKPAQA